MKSRLCSTVTLVLIAFLLAPTIGGQIGAPRKNLLKNIRAKSQKGPKVRDRIEQLRATHGAVRGALEAFEKRGYKPKIDDAITVTGSIDLTSEVPHKKTHHAAQQSTVTGDGVEIIFITVVDLYNEWQGTAIANFFDANGALEEQYVADVVITRSEYSYSELTARFELKFESDGVGYLNHRPGMFTSFNLGTPVQQQAAPLNLVPSQFSSTEQMDAYYNLYPEQILIDSMPGGGGGGGDILPILPTRLSKPQGWSGRPPISPWTFYTITGWGPMAQQVGRGCSATTVGCGVAAWLGAPALACAAGTCATVTINAAMNNLSVVRR